MNTRSNNFPIKQPWTQPHQKILTILSVSMETGLDQKEIAQRRKKYGSNRLRETKQKSAWRIFFEQFESLIMVLLAVAAGLSFAFGQWLEGFAIIAVITFTVAIGFITEIKAVRSMEALRQLSRVSANVRRNGQVQQISAEDLVVGDIVLFGGGDLVTADLRLIEANKLLTDESALTGESTPVSKTTGALEKEEVPLAERANMIFKGTSITRGSGAGVVVATGMNTELGTISTLVEEAAQEMTPIERRIDQLGRRLIWITIAIAAMVAIIGIVRGKEVFFMIQTAIALAVAAIPEGLPIVATIALARGVMRMAKRNALINRLGSVETLGATNVIFTDKTGTLTENKMTVASMTLDSGEIEITGEGFDVEAQFKKDDREIDPHENRRLKEALKVGVLCSNASMPQEQSENDNGKIVGDPLEVALLVAGTKAKLARDELIQEMPEEREEAFDSATKMMATFHQENGGYYVAVKGAPEAVLENCAKILTAEGPQDLSDEQKKKLLDINNKMAQEGLRMLALAHKKADTLETAPYEDLTFLALAALFDPPRAEVIDAIASCAEAGVRVIMVTGDQPATAHNIAAQVGLLDGKNGEVVQGKDLKSDEDLSEDELKRILQVPIFARVDPKQKLDLISIHQHHGSIVAMTGDGVNDAPALKKADIGIAMGKRGTQVAYEAADMILKDDAFATIVVAIQHGRVIFDNIRKFVIFLLSGNVGEVLSVAVATLANAPLPLLPLQILFINMILDVFPALALGVGEGNPGVMKRPPRDPQEPLLARQHWLMITGYGVLITLAVLGALVVAILWFDMPEKQAVTISFLTLGFARLWHVFNMRDNDTSIFRNEITRNPYVWGALVLCTALLLMAAYLPGLVQVLNVVDPGTRGWLLIISMSLAPLVIGQILKSVAVKKRN